MIEGRKDGWASKLKPGPLFGSKSGSATGLQECTVFVYGCQATVSILMVSCCNTWTTTRLGSNSPSSSTTPQDRQGSIYFKGRGEKRWVITKKNLAQPKLLENNRGRAGMGKNRACDFFFAGLFFYVKKFLHKLLITKNNHAQPR